MWIRTAVAGWTLAMAVASVAGQVPNAPSPRLGKITRLSCSFSVLASSNWKDGEPTSAVSSTKKTVTFNSVDTQDGTAEAVGDSGKAHITVRLLGSYLHFMQLDPYGALHVTTVFDRDGKAGRLLAVHTRHEYTPVSLPGLTSRPEQYVGDCEIR